VEQNGTKTSILFYVFYLLTFSIFCFKCIHNCPLKYFCDSLMTELTDEVVMILDNPCEIIIIFVSFQCCYMLIDCLLPFKLRFFLVLVMMCNGLLWVL
jgi:hypothetical protein